MIKDKVSIIMPTCNRYDIAIKNVENLQSQNYPNFDIIVCDDSDSEIFHKGSAKFRKSILEHKNVKYLYCARFDVDGKKDYGLARARNFGIIESDAEFLVFLDDRITAANNELLSVFVSKLKPYGKRKMWLFGDKGAQKKSFVENCSAVKRENLIDAGMFCERIDKYGGMTRELERRLAHQGFRFRYEETAKAMQLHKSTGWDKKPEQIKEMRERLKRMWE